MTHRALRTRLTATVFGALLVLAGCGEETTGESGEDTSSPAVSSPAASEAASPSSDASASGGGSAEGSAGSGLTRTQKLITLKQPAENASVSGSFTASGTANSPEANVPWEIRDQSGEVVLDGFATAEGWMDKLYPWKTTVDVSSLEPGSYTFVAMTDDPSGGAEGSGPQQVGATITVT